MREINIKMLDAIKGGKLEDVRNLVENEGADILTKDSDGLSALHLAAFNGHKEIVEYLVINQNFQFNIEARIQDNNQIILENRDIKPNFGPLSLSYIPVKEIAGDDLQLAANVIFMRGLTSTFARTNALPKLQGRVNLNSYLNMAIRAIEIIQRSRDEADYIPQNPHKPQLNRKLEFQMEALAWVSSCLTLAFFKNPNLDANNPEIPFAQIRNLINITDLININRGRQHGADGIVFVSDKTVIDNFMPDLLSDLDNLAIRLRHVVNPASPAATNAQTCENIKSLSDYYNDLSILTIVKFYTELMTNPHFQLTSTTNREAMLRGLEAIGEAISIQLSPQTRGLYNGLNINALSDVRNYLDHINGDLRENRVLNRASRAARLEELIKGRDIPNLQVLENIRTKVIAKISERTDQIIAKFDQAISKPEIPEVQQVLFGAGAYDPFAFDQAVHDYHMDTLLDQNQEAEADALNQTKANIQQLHNGFTHQRMPPMLQGEYDHLAKFSRFLSARTDLIFNSGVMGDLKAINTNDVVAWKAQAKRFLGLSNLHANQNQDKLLLLMHLTRSINPNMEYVEKTADRLKQVWQDFNDFPKGLGRFTFGSPKASVAMSACIKSLEYNLINFCEHAHEICNNQSYRTYYKRSFNKDIKDYFEDLIFQTRNYFSHITTNKHNTKEPIDHSNAMLKLREEFIALTPKLKAVQNEMLRDIVPLLNLSPAYNRERLDVNSWALRHIANQINPGIQNNI